MNVDNKTPLQSFINQKADTLMQCGNYSIDIPPLQEGEQYRFHFDATACVGCHCCEAACNEQNANPADVKWRRVGEMEGGEFPHVTQLFNSMSCNHCIDPACLNGCPTQSYIKLDNGIVFHEDESCIGCQYCTWNCPYEVPTFNKDRGIVTKCHMCVEKLEASQTPACVQACPAGAIEIEVLNKEQWIKNDMATQGVAPHLPDIKVTKPTTRYTLPDNLPSMKPADEHITKPAHAELPLVFMTVLTQMSLGAMVALFLGQLLSLFGFSNLAPTNVLLALFVIAPALIGLPLSALHLGRPILAGTAMKNIKHSWLSREALALGLFAGLGVMSVGALFIDSRVLTLGFSLLACVTGVYGIYAQSMIYRIPARPAWNRTSTTKRFFASAYLGLLLVAFILSLQGFGTSAMVVLTLSILLSGYQLLLIHEERGFYHYLQEEQTNFYQLNKSKILLEEHFKKHLQVRYFSLIGFALVLPMMSIVFLANGTLVVAGSLLALSLLGAMLSELIGRYLFYVTVVPLGLAGNFFAGNQRG
ncbi:MAG: DmsC/YnfH family molybdoenzyme membrane anchor subunit [Campylobacterota bacterium]|nr:DmsC/YnfH family molybdoenzyme membrane anchor subunit [Campylobacterota bacterium]